MADEEYKIKTTHAAFVDPSTVSDECLPMRLSRCAECLQEHTCNEGCLVRKLNPTQMRRRGFDPAKDQISDLTPEVMAQLMKCKKNFPKIVPEGAGELQAHVIMDFNKIVRYNPPRDNPYINNFHPVFMHLWGANTDLQVMHGKGTCI